MTDPAQSIDGQRLQLELTKLRGHFHGTQASVAKLLKVIESTLLNDQKTTLESLTATKYYSALVSTLQSIGQRKSGNHQVDYHQTELDILYLLAIVIHSLPKPVLKSESLSILELIQPRLDLLIHPNSSPPDHHPILPENRTIGLKSIISILEPIYLSFSSVELKSIKLQSISQSICLRSILPLILAQQPKLRRASQSLISQIIDHPPTPLLIHPYLPHVIQFILDQLESLISNYSTEPELSNTLIISLIKFTQSILPRFPLDRLDRLVFILLSPLPKLNNPFLTTTVFNTLESLFGPTSQLDENRTLSTLTSIHHLETTNPVSLTAKLNAVEHGWTCLARIAPETCSRELPKLAKFTNLFEHFGNPNQNVREASRSFLSAICRYCLTDQEIHLASQAGRQTTQLQNHHSTSIESIQSLILIGLGSSEIIAAGGTVELIAVLKSLAMRLRNRPQGDQPDSLPYAARLLKDHIVALDKLRSKPIGIESIIDETLGCICQICGPAFLLDTLPLNLKLDEDDGQDSHQSSPGRAWLLTVIKVFNSSLGHFISYFVPLSEKLFEKKRNALKLSNDKQIDPKSKEKCLLQVKIYDTLIDQIWRLLPGYCDVPWDLELAFNRSFAELLAQIIYSQPTLRPPILNSLKILVDKTLTLAQRSLPSSDSNSIDQQAINGSKLPQKNEFGFDAQSHLDHLKSFSANFLSVLFNVYNSSYDATKNSPKDQKASNSNRGYMVDCMRSMLEIIPEQELNASYQKIKSVLDQSINAKSQSAVTIQKMLDLLVVLLPRLVSSSKPDILREILNCICQDVFLLSADSNIQKKSYKLLTTLIELICQQGKINIIEDVGCLIEKLIAIETTAKVSGPTKRDRALLISELVSIIPSDKLHFIPKLLTEVVLGCKESNSEVRVVSYDGLIKIGRKMKEHGGKVDWKALLGEIEGDEKEMKDVEQEATIEEYFKMISAGLAGTSPHMVSATIAALSRVLFEFHNELSRSTIEELIATIEIFLNSPNREIAKTAIGFMKVAVVSLPKELVIHQLDQIIPGLLKWANEHKNYFKSNIQNLLERLLRKFGFEVLEKFVVNRDENDGGRKLVYSLNKKQKKKKKQQETRKSNDPNDDESDAEHQPNQARLGDAYEEALYGSDSSVEDEADEENNAKSKKNTKKGHSSEHSTSQKLSNNLLEDDEDQIMNLLDGGRMTNRAMAGKLARVEKRKQELKKIGSGYKKDSSTGKMIIEAEESDESADDSKQKSKELNSTNAYLEAINGEDSFKRDARGNVKFNKKRKQPQSNLEEDQDLIEDGVSSFHLDNSKLAEDVNQKAKKSKRVKEHLGSEFKAKKAGGDRVSKDGKGVKPFAYLPLSSINSKKKKIHVSKNLNITGKTKGSKS